VFSGKVAHAEIRAVMYMQFR